MTNPEARTKIKNRLDINDSSFDSLIDDFVLSAVDRLYPLVQRTIPAQEKAISVSNGLAELELGSLTTPAEGVKKVEAISGTTRTSLSDFYVHGTSLTIYDVPANITTVRVYGLARYTALADIPANLTQAVIWYAMSEFYDMLSAEKGRYNEYMSSGARNVDNMRDQSDYYEQKANVYLVDRVTIHGTN